MGARTSTIKLALAGTYLRNNGGANFHDCWFVDSIYGCSKNVLGLMQARSQGDSVGAEEPHPQI